MCTSFCADTCFHFSRVELLVHMVTLCPLFWGTARLFSRNGCTMLQSYQHSYQRVLISLYPHQHLLLSVYHSVFLMFILKMVSPLKMAKSLWSHPNQFSDFLSSSSVNHPYLQKTPKQAPFISLWLILFSLPFLYSHHVQYPEWAS